MFHLTKGAQSDIICTLTESLTFGSWFRFRFNNNETGQSVDIVVSADTDRSDYPDRFNQFRITTDNYFTGKQEGQWSYKVYEQAEEITEADETKIIETGLMQLHPSTETEQPATYEPPIKSIKVYQGE
jgi:hypothetical protein